MTLAEKNCRKLYNGAIVSSEGVHSENDCGCSNGKLSQ